ncbi:unnamed protein product, partial [Medioppia subpectinata]
MFKLSDKFHEIRGNYYGKRFLPSTVEYALDYKPRSRDRIMLTYPKSGTWWAEFIVTQLMAQGRKPDTNELFYRKYFLEYHGKALLDREAGKSAKELGEVTFIRSHLAFKLFPYRPEPRYLLLLRNPKDVCVSFYYYFKEVFEMDIDFKEYFKLWISGKSELPFGDYFEAVRDYWSHRDDPNCTLVIYEYMLANPAQGVRQIATFLGPKYVARLTERESDTGETLLERVVRESSFNAMKGSLNKSDPHFRSGKSGDWRSHLNRPESDAIDARAAQVWAGTGLLELWKREMD